MQPAPRLDLVHAAIGEVFGPTHAEARLAAYQRGGDGDFHHAPLTPRRGLHAINTHITIRGLPTVIKTYRQASEAQDAFPRPIVLLVVRAATNHGPLKREFQFLPIPRQHLSCAGCN